ncbi:MAG: hypothetical protein J6Q39_07035 [Bacteroidales bacterium]|nr:hypothetical protein [Bacteroidales bacterium]
MKYIVNGVTKNGVMIALSYDVPDEFILLVGERSIDIWLMRKSGMKLREIGDIYGISRERIRQIYERTERRYRIRYDPAFEHYHPELLKSDKRKGIVKCSISSSS